MKKFILITGISSGIGKHIASQYSVLDNYQVIGIDVNDCLDNKNLIFFKGDLREESQTIKIFNQISRIDVAINCAGVSSTRKSLTDFSSVELLNCLQDNLAPTFNATKYELQIMKAQNQGKIINFASISAHIGMKNFLAYSTAKAAIVNMTKVAAIENSEYNIQINSISPATIDTPMIRKKYNGQLKDYSNIYYTKTCGNTADIYTIVKMLEENNFMTGSDIKLDGGLTELFKI